ncbi:MAG: MBOAT family protein [Pseudomonadales bacterium]|nr:MBOAT family protein [Pseudomonadales bacterium]
MLFNTPLFVAFISIFHVLYGLTFAKNTPRVLLIIIASLIFYGAWDYRFIPLLMFSGIVDYTVANLMDSTEDQQQRKRLLFISIATNLGILGIFKYLNFMIESVQASLGWIGLDVSLGTLSIVLPVGISFYTFQSMSYTIDVYRGETHARKSFLPFFATLSFFPQLVAGPILRARQILPQIETIPKIEISNIQYGLVLITMGLVKKTIADLLSAPAQTLFNNPEPLSWIETLTGVLAFAGQIYGDFSGYSDIAIGLALILGIKIPLNFNTPYFSVSPVEFWKRWHISLSSWLRDYLYISLGGNRNNRQIRNVFITMLLGGLWHGAAWTFVAWGAFHGLIISATHLLRRTTIGKWFGNQQSRWLTLCQWLFTFYLICIGWVFFRAESISSAFSIIADLHQPFSTIAATPYAGIILGLVIFSIVMVHVLDHWIIKHKSTLEKRFWWFLPLLILGQAFVFMIGEPGHEFIYFQF